MSIKSAFLCRLCDVGRVFLLSTGPAADAEVIAHRQLDGYVKAVADVKEN